MDNKTPIKILEALHDLYDQKPTAILSTHELADILKISIKEAQGALIYLKEKDWINSYQKTDDWYQKINAYGIDELQRINSSSKKLASHQTQTHSLDMEVQNDNFQGIMKVFISHKFVKEDQKLALVLQKMLREKDINGYLAERIKEYDLLIRDKIRQEIENSDYVIGIITNESKSSASLNQELGYALAANIPVVLLVEKGVPYGVLTHGKETEEFTRENFTKNCNNVLDYILEKGPRKKITREDITDLIANVYRPCYNQMINIYNSRKFIHRIPENKWIELEPFWRLKTEPEMKEIFEKYTEEREKWSKLWIEFANAFQNQQHALGTIVAKAFDKAGLIKDKNSHIFLDDRSSMESRNWIQAFDQVIFDTSTNDPEALYQNLLNYSIQTKNGHQRWLEKWWNENNGLFSNLLEIIPELKRNFSCSVTKQQLDEQREILKESIEKLTLALEQKLV